MFNSGSSLKRIILPKWLFNFTTYKNIRIHTVARYSLVHRKTARLIFLVSVSLGKHGSTQIVISDYFLTTSWNIQGANNVTEI